MKGNKLMTLFAAVLMLLGVQSANAAIKLTCLGGDGFGEGEGCQKLFDGTKETKWGSWTGWYHTYASSEDEVYAICKASLPIAPTSYELIIANDTWEEDNWGRNWRKWKVYGGNFESDDKATKDAEGWVLLDDKDQVLPTGTEENPFEVVPLKFSDPDGNFYTYFKIEVEGINTENPWDAYCQMAEFSITGYTVDISAFAEQIQKCKEFDLTGVDAPLAAEYNAKLEAVSSAEEPSVIENLINQLNTLQIFITESKDLAFATVAAVGSGVWGDGVWSHLIDGNMDTKCGGGLPNDGAWLVFRANGGAAPYVYTLTTGKDTKNFPGRNWKNWKIYGANFTNVADATRTAEGWVLLDSRENVGQDLFPAENLSTAAFSFSEFPEGLDKKYYYFKVELEAVYNGSQYQMTELGFLSKQQVEETRNGFLAEFDGFDAVNLKVEDSMADKKSQFITKLEELKTTNDALTMSKLYNSLKELRKELLASAAFVAGDCYHALNGNTAWGDGENHTKLVDGDHSTKWGGGMPDGGSYVIFKAYEAKAFNQYMLITGNDTKNSPGRNWKTWKIWGANIKGDMDEMATRDFGSWTLIDQKENIGNDRLPAANFAPAYFSISKEWEQGYKYFMIEVEAAAEGGSIQMSEFKFLSDEEYTTIRQEYVDSLTKVSMALADLGEGIELPDDVKQKLIAQFTETIGAKITAVATATADNLLPNFNEAINYITVEVPAIIAANTMAQVDGVYQISAAPQLANFASIVNGGATDAKAVLTTDIDLAQVITNEAWTSIGNSGKPFKGTFDGQGHTIKNITYTATGQYNGLFGKLTTGAVVKNFTAEGTMTVSTGIKDRAVALIALTEGDDILISNINSKMNYNNQLAGSQVGGVLGGANSGHAVVDRCTYSGRLDGNDGGGNGNYGGLVGYALNNGGCYLTISNCLFDGELVNTAATPGNCTFGGIVGYAGGSPTVAIKNCLSIGTVKSAVAGQFFGAVKSSKCSVKDSYYMGTTVNGLVQNSPSIAATEVTDEQLASNEVVLKLGVAFRQDVGKDAYPTLDATKPVVIEISEAGYATLFIDNADLTIPEGVTASTGLIMGDFLKLNPIEGKIATGEAVVLKGDAGVYSFAPTTGAVKAENNDLKGAATDAEAAGMYVLAKPEGKAAGFYKANEGTIKAGKAYLEVPATEVKAFLFEGEDATGIANVNVNDNQTSIYNLAGQRINKLQKGINIVGGKKILF